VYKIQLVRGIPFYGFYPCERLFLKVFLYNPMLQTRIVNLLRSGAIMGKLFQVYEAHIPFTLQVFIDYNLYGMAMLNLDTMRFRAPLPTHRKHTPLEYDIDTTAAACSSLPPTKPRVWLHCNTPIELLLDATLAIERQSTCELEIDTSIESMLHS
jgi:DNA polymerase zeta